MMRATVVQPFIPPFPRKDLAPVMYLVGRPHHVRSDLLRLALVGVVIGPLGLVLQSTGGPQLSPETPRMAVRDRGYAGS